MRGHFRFTHSSHIAAKRARAKAAREPEPLPPQDTLGLTSYWAEKEIRLRADSDDYELTLSFDDLSYWERIVSLGVAVSEDFQCRTLALVPIGLTLIGLTTVVSMDCAFCFHRGRNGHFCPLSKLPTLSTAAASGGYGARLSWRWGLSTCAALLLGTVFVFIYRISPLLISTTSGHETGGDNDDIIDSDHQSLLGSRRREGRTRNDTRRSLRNNRNNDKNSRLCSCVPARNSTICHVHELVDASRLPSLLLWSALTCSISLVFLAHSEDWHLQTAHYAAAVIYWLSSFVFLLALLAIRRCAWDVFPRKDDHQGKRVTFGADEDVELGPVPSHSRSSSSDRRRRQHGHRGGSDGTTLTDQDTPILNEAALRLRERRSGALPPPWDCNQRCHRYGWQLLSEVFVGGAVLCSVVTLTLRLYAQGQPDGDERLKLGWQGLAQQMTVSLQLLSVAPLWADLVAASPAGALAALMNARHQVLKSKRHHSRANDDDDGKISDSIQDDATSRRSRRRRERAINRSNGERVADLSDGMLFTCVGPQIRSLRLRNTTLFRTIFFWHFGFSGLILRIQERVD